MAKTWSNRKRTAQALPIGRAAVKKSSVSLFVIVMCLIVAFFGSLMTYVTVSILSHPPAEDYGPPSGR